MTRVTTTSRFTSTCRARLRTRPHLTRLIIRGRRSISEQGLTAARIRSDTQGTVPCRRVGNIPRLRRALSITRARRRPTIDNHESSSRRVASRAYKRSWFLILLYWTIPRALVDIQLIKIHIHDVARVKTKEARIARNHTLRISTRRHLSKIAQLKVFNNLRSNFDGVSYLLDGQTKRTAFFTQCLSKTTGH